MGNEDLPTQSRTATRTRLPGEINSPVPFRLSEGARRDITLIAAAIAIAAATAPFIMVGATPSF